MAVLVYGQDLSIKQMLSCIEMLQRGRMPRVSWDKRVKTQVSRSARFVQTLAKSDVAYYGVNTGFGALKDVRISQDAVEQLQHNIIRSHAAGVGCPLAFETAALVVLLRVHCLSQGYSGVRIDVLRFLNKVLAAGYVPLIPEQGSVGASGDLAPLAHMARVLLGEGMVRRYEGRWEPTRKVLRRLKMPPMELKAKEGLALVNGLQVSLALLLVAYTKAIQLLSRSVLVLGMSLDAFEASLSPFDSQVAELRRHDGAKEVCRQLRRLLEGSSIVEHHQGCKRVQDPYSFRCSAHVLGSAWDAMFFVGNVLQREINAVTDNPIVLDGQLVSNGNFHGASLAAAADFAKIAMAEVGNISERRLRMMIDPQFNPGVSRFLAKRPGLESGLMMLQVTAASLVSENKTLVGPQSVDSIPTNLDAEDHVSMSTVAARYFFKMLETLEIVLACECLAAYRALAFRRPLKSSSLIEKMVAELKRYVPSQGHESPPSGELDAVLEWFRSSKTLYRFETDCFRPTILSQLSNGSG